MASRRRKQRRSATRNTASLLALALPAPLQRLANSPVGPLLMFFGLPAMLVAGLLQIDWQNGAPHLKVNQEKASEIGQAVHDRLEKLPNHTAIEHWQQTARDTWNSHVQNSSQQNSPTYPNQSGPASPGNYPASNWPAPNQPPHTTSTPQSGMVNPYTRAPFPSTKPPGYVSTTNNSQPKADQGWGELQQQQQYLQQQQYAQQQQYSQQQYSQQQYSQQQYSQQQYSQQQYSQQQYSQQQQYAQQQSPSQQYQPQQYTQQQQYQPQQQYPPQPYQQQQYAPEQQYQQPASPAQIPWQTR